MYFTVEEENLICLRRSGSTSQTNKQNAGRGGCQSLCVRRFFFATKHKSKPACLFISKLGRITMLIGIIMIQIAPKFF